MTFEELIQQKLQIAADIKTYWPRTPGGKVTAYSGEESLEIDDAVDTSDLWLNDINDDLFYSTHIWVELTAEGAAWILGGYLHHILSTAPVSDGTGILNGWSPFFVDFAVLTCCAVLMDDHIISCCTVELTTTLKRIDPGLFPLTALTVNWMLNADELFANKLFAFTPDDVAKLKKNWNLPLQA